MGAVDLNYGRRNLLRGRVAGLRDQPLRPPWAKLANFLDLCTRCSDCVRACEENILVVGDGGYPVVDFKRGECSFCEACVIACKTGALSREISPPWLLKAQVNEQRCLAVNGITCRSCGDVCDSRSIQFKLMRAGRVDLLIDFTNCTGCGACTSVCAANALTMTPCKSTQPKNGN